MSMLLFKKNTDFNIFKMATAMTSLPRIMETAIARLIWKIETCKWCQNVGIEVGNPMLLRNWNILSSYEDMTFIVNYVYISR